jgi:hypothetical protein
MDISFEVVILSRVNSVIILFFSCLKSGMSHAIGKPLSARPLF